MGLPFALASSTNGLSALGSSATFPLRSALSVMLWPFRLSIQGMTMGLLGEPRRPMVEAMGMPVSMWVAWMSPLERASRMAAQLAPLLTVEWIPYFLKKPFSCAITIGEQSVSAIMPNLRSLISGPSAVPLGPGSGLAEAVPSDFESH